MYMNFLHYFIKDVFTHFSPLQRMSGEVEGHREKMEALLSSMMSLASHDTILQCSPISEYSDKLRSDIHVHVRCTMYM